MRCRYCGSEASDDAVRCAKCMRRLDGPGSLPAVIETAVAHDLDYAAGEPVKPKKGPRLAAVNPGVARKPAPVQPSLFPFRDDQKIVQFDHAVAEPRRRVATEGGRSARRKVDVGQSAFNFDAPPSPNVLAHASDKNTHLEAAPLALRSMSAMFDAGLAGGLTGLFLTTVRLTLGHLPSGTTAYIAYAVGAALFFFLYKLLYCLYGQPTFGLQGARLRVVTFQGGEPSRSQLFIRHFAGCVSVVSAGMGLMWALADQDKLSWHDHISQTFLTADQE